MRKTAWMLAGILTVLLSAHAAAAEDDGLRSGANALSWARWQGRLSLVTTTDPWRLGVEGQRAKLSSASLMGDYYFARSLAGPDRLGGLRATSGLIFGPRSGLAGGPPDPIRPNAGSTFNMGSRSSIGRPVASPYASDAAAEASATMAYLGIGYTGLAPRSGWGFSADLGLVAKGASNAPRAGGGPTLDDLVRDLRMSPLLQFGVSYSF